ncbi:sulfatase-like hydrolase/transferase [Candidatus Nitrospira allomarina]|uniref:Sulfatase-like hydrolase/transferase n=1 Tax=Candidatus Nitrospira allomarina TaxID=3020900 RepID=A0AA96GGI7_9BACT|nr:sulfatase-like hydrolase/transferase [Candidatus Nitrospira allomarina]WNM59890.1 sulfatase-like hydrolase/transferase [Candidatus Nitrospira allomarina]
MTTSSDELNITGIRMVLVEFLHLFALVGFAVAQPLYDLLGQNPEFFVSYKAGPELIIGMVFVLSLGMASGLVLLELAALSVGRRVWNSLHLVFVFGLAFLTVLPPVQRLEDGSDFLIVGFALLIGFLFSVLYVRWQAVRLFLTVLSPVVVAFPLWFLLFTPVGRLVMPEAIKAQADIEINNPVPVVLIVLDEFNITALLDAEGRIDPVRFPNFAALAAQSYWFPNAVATYVETAAAVSGILTGRQPRAGVRLNPTATDHPQNLFTLLGDRYALNVVESLTSLCPHTLCKEEDGDAGSSIRYKSFFADLAVIYLHIIAPPQIGKQLPPLHAQWTGFGEELLKNGILGQNESDIHLDLVTGGKKSRESQITSFLSQIKQTSSPVLHFLHVILPHTKYEYLASGQQYLNKERFIPVGWIDGPGWGGRWIGKESLILTAYHQYLQQIGYVDQFLGKLRSSLERAELFDKALIIVTADHGVSFQRGLSMREVQKGNESDILKVPMFVKLPGQREGTIRERLVSGIDVLPTIADLLDFKIPREIDGYSMLDNEIPPRDEIDFLGVGKIKSQDLNGFPRLKWQVDHFGEHTALDRLVPKGPASKLIGQELGDLDISHSTSLKYINESPHQFGQGNLEKRVIPALFSGQIIGTSRRNIPIAISLNERIWATTQASLWAGKRNYFSVLFPPSAFRSGENQVRVFLIGDHDTQLTPIPLASQGTLSDEQTIIRLKHEVSGQSKLVFSGEREIFIDVGEKHLTGNLDRVLLSGESIVVEGWAADLEKNQPAEEVFIFTNGKLTASTEVGISRQDVVEAHQQKALFHSGFRIKIPIDVLKPYPSDIKLIVASLSNRAWEFSFSPKQMDFIRSTLEQEDFSQ